MNYLSTRGDATPRKFCDILLEGLAPDGGLYLPEHYLAIDAARLAALRRIHREQGYAALAFEILSLYIDDIPAADLRAICERTYTAEVFGTPRSCLDAAARGLLPGGNVQRPHAGLQGHGSYAAAGPTVRIRAGPAAGRSSISWAPPAATPAARPNTPCAASRGVRVFMLSPHGRMSTFQQAQMFSLQDENIHNIAIEGVFDDCQDIVKAVSNDLAFKRRYKIGTVNSINWARLLAQVVYYFAGYFQATRNDSEQVDFTVPSGNFGNICAGHVARQMGLPIGQLVVATNENDVLDEFFRTGVYRVRGSADTHETSSPSMDISKASNFERFVFDLLGRDGARTRALFHDALLASGRFDLGADPAFAEARSRYGFVSGKSTHADRLATIRELFQQHGVMIDTHTADGVKVARPHVRAGVPMIVLETALPIKFAATIREALGRDPERPARFNGIEQLPRRVQVMPADAAGVKAFVAENCE